MGDLERGTEAGITEQKQELLRMDGIWRRLLCVAGARGGERRQEGPKSGYPFWNIR